MKEQILKLRSEGKSYRQIQEALGCSKATISYHCGKGQKEKLRNRTNRYRDENPLLGKVDHFKSRLINYGRVTRKGACSKLNYTYSDIISKFGMEPTCYLTGAKVNFLDKDSFSLDHIIPRSRGGSNSLDNMGITTPQVNQAKYNLLVPEFLQLCEKVLLNNGYKVEKPLDSNSNLS